MGHERSGARVKVYLARSCARSTIVGSSGELAHDRENRHASNVRNGSAKPVGYVLPLRIERLEDGRYLARSPKLPGLNVQGDSIAEVLRLAPKIARSLLAAMRSKGVPPPRGLVAAKSSLRIQVLVRA
jgi:predicted RNase H-like HicB family nuclease